MGPLKVAPYASPSSHAKSDAFANRILLAASVFKTHKIAAGETLVLIPALTSEELQKRLSLEQESGKVEQRKFALGVAWPSTTLEGNTVSAHPSLLQDIADTGDLVLLSPISKSGLSVQLATDVQVSVVESPTSQGKGAAQDPYLLAYLKQLLCDQGHVRSGQTLSFSYSGRTASVKLQVKAAKRADVYRVESSSTVSYAVNKVKATVNGVIKPANPSTASTTLLDGQSATYDAVGGLDAQIQQIRELVELPLTRSELYSRFALPLPRGLLLHGPPGTGKTLLASAVASSLGIPLFVVDGPSLSSPFHGETEERLRNVFTQAGQSEQGGIIVIDEIDALAPKREDAGEVERRVVATLLTLMDGVDTKRADQPGGHVMVIAATNRPNALDPALRRPGRFDREIEIGVPNADARLSILKVLLRNTPHQLSPAVVKAYADRSHGFVGADLAALVRTAAVNGIRRSLATSLPVEEMQLAEEDLESALLVTRPSAMREVLVETPHTRWADVGGLESVKQRLKESVEWPLQHPESFKRLGIRPPTGVLLYGPPGCSKTLIARALATEAKLNFITIKGPEVFNKYVGESERTIRDTFRKARLAAPSILFIDEIDAIASVRDSEDSSPSSNRVLTTLLTEMDGVEELVGVTIVAATNRPFAIDTALLRPGRLDHLLYLPPPDLEARTAIFSIQIGRMSVEEGVRAYDLAQQTEGRSGAEIASICQEAAMRAMHEDRDAKYVKREHFLAACSIVRKRISTDMLAEYEAWRDEGGAL